MTECADCRGSVGRETGRIYVKSERTALLLCRSCQTRYPREKQYKPRGVPRLSRMRIDGVELDG